jgi:hypothetical protein
VTAPRFDLAAAEGIGHTMLAAATAYLADLRGLDTADLATYVGILNDALAALTGPDGLVDELLNERSLTQYQMGQKALKDAGVWA